MHFCQWASSATSHVGSVRAVNEDNFLDAPQSGLWCVADGMGGHERGDLASTLIVTKLSELLDTNKSLSINAIEKAIHQVNAELLMVSKEQGATIGSTVAILFIQNNTAHVLWAGDSRIYRFNDDKLSCITKDHNQAEELVNLGLLTPEEAFNHPGSNLITRAVGTRRQLILEHKQFECAKSETFLLCTDGLTAVMQDADIEKHLLTSVMSESSKMLIDNALERYAHDNVSAIVVKGNPSS